MGTGEKDVESSAPTTQCKEKLMDLSECIQDSPNFRIQLKDREKEIADLESRLEKVVTACDRMVSSGVQYTDASRAFSVSVKDLAAHFKENEVIAGTLTRFYEILKELQSYYSILFDQAQRSVQSSLRAFLSGELKKVKETKKVFHKVSDELNSCTIRNATVPRSKVQECDEASVQLGNAQNAFSHHAIDYGYQINTISCVKGHEILSNLLSYMRAQFTFFHQGYDLLHEFDPFMRQVGTQVDLFRKGADEAVKEMDSRHNLVASHHLQDGSLDIPLLPMGNPTMAVETSGYLFKKPRGNSLFKTWSRRWFILQDNKLVYQSESKDEEYSVVAEDMRICTVKYADDLERRFCFEVVTPWRSCMVQADSDALRRKWVSYIEASIARALRISASAKKIEDDDHFQRRSMTVVDKREPIHILQSSPKEKKQSFSMAFTFLAVPGNSKCADCDGENPTWASINLGIMLCIECSGIHRSLGVHISKVRSVTLDDWEPDLQKIMCQLGNTRVNAIYEYDIPSHVKKPTKNSTRAARETFIRLKYAQHAFVHPHPNFERPEIPLPPPTIPELLAPSKSPLIHRSGGSPKSPTRRSFSPSFKLRSPRLQKGVHAGVMKSSSRPSSASSMNNISDQSTPADSIEDLHKAGLPGSRSGSLQLLADNLTKLEKSGKLKNWSGNTTSLSDKIRNTARRSSRRISTYAKDKLREARGKLKSKEKGTREVHSDIDDEELATTSTPLLYSMSASTQNLSSYATGTPPPKPPRTFATKRLSGGSNSDEDLFKDSGDFSDILSAIKEMGVLCKSSSSIDDLDDEAVIPNGRIPETSSSSKLKKSESSPQLSHNKLNKPEPSTTRSNGNSPRQTPLNTIAEDQSTKHIEEVDSNRLAVSNNSIDLPPTSDTETVDKTGDDRLPNSVPLRRKKMLGPSTSFDASNLANSTLASSEGDIPSSIQASETSLTKRFSILSTTSADFFSADSSEGSDSKAPSVSVSPDFTTHLNPHPAPVDALRSASACSEDECFSTPPSTPTLPDSTRNTMERKLSPPVEDVDHVTNSSTNQKPAADDATGMTSPLQGYKVQTLKSTPTRMRSLTLSDSHPPPRSAPYLYVTRSKDDNYETETKRRSTEGGSLVSSFSQQDMMEIFGGEQMRIDPAVGQRQPLSIPEEIAEEKETSLEVVAPEETGEVGEMTGGSPLSVGGDPVTILDAEGVDPVIIPDTVTPDEFLCSSVLASNLPGILCALAHGGKINANLPTSDGDKAPILLAIEAANYALTEYLFQNGAKLNCTDSQGRGCLHYAVLADQCNMVVTLLKRGVKPELKDEDGKDSITYALERENGDIVTMLRMATFREQAEQGSDNRQSQYLEELQSEFFRDIEVATLVDSERSRKSTTSDSSSVASRDS